MSFINSFSLIYDSSYTIVMISCSALSLVHFSSLIIFKTVNLKLLSSNNCCSQIFLVFYFSVSWPYFPVSLYALKFLYWELDILNIIIWWFWKSYSFPWQGLQLLLIETFLVTWSHWILCSSISISSWWPDRDLL